MRLLERAHERERLWGTKLDAVMAYSAAFLALARLERGDPLEQVSATLHRIEPRDPRPDGARFWLASLAELHLAEGRPEEAIAVTEQLEGARPADTHPVWAPCRGQRARALAQLDRRDEARGLAEAEVDLARRTGAGWVIGRGLRLVAEVDPGRGTEAALEAVAQLSPTSARLELARAHLVLGDALHAQGDRPAASDEWSRAEAAAEACGAGRLLGDVGRRRRD
jgi:tetratricopeptide (TPR) repeat protein